MTLVWINDGWKAALSLCLVYTYMAIYTRAPFIAALGSLSVLASIPLATAILAICGHSSMPAVNLLVLFLLTGIGADNLFVLTDTWRQTKREHTEVLERLQALFSRAGKSITACGVTTAISFLSNLFSSVRPLRSFGLFVGICVLCDLALCLGMLPAVLVLREMGKTSHTHVQKTALRKVDGGFDDIEDIDIQLEDGEKDRQGANMTSNWLDTERQEPVVCAKESLRDSVATPDDALYWLGGRDIAYGHVERFFGDVYSQVVWRCRYGFIGGGLLISFIGLVLSIVACRSPSAPTPLLEPDRHNLGAVAVVRRRFSKDSVWTPDMQASGYPLHVCPDCKRGQECQWGSWGDWSWCSPDCVRTRFRAVQIPAGLSGKSCTGHSDHLTSCNHSNACTNASAALLSKVVGNASGSHRYSSSSEAMDGSHLSEVGVATVHVVFGLKEQHGGPGTDDMLYDKTFDFSHPAVQVAVEHTCSLVADLSRLASNLAVRRVDCFINDFKKFITSQCGGCTNCTCARWPMSEPAELLGFLQSFLKVQKYGAKWGKSIGFSKGRVRWLRLDFVTNIPMTLDAEDALKVALHWDAFIAARAASQSGMKAGSIFHTSPLWVRADFESGLIGSTMLSAAGSITFAFVAVACFLWNVMLAAQLMLTIVSYSASLA
jgi:hypothetical protein